MLSLILSIFSSQSQSPSPSPSPSPPDDDARMLERVAGGDERALRVLYERYAGKIQSTAQRLLGGLAEAEEIVQETFIDIWHRAGSFDRTRGTAAPWILGIGRNRAIDRLRARATRQRTLSLVADAPPAIPQSPERELFKAQNERMVARALDALPAELRTVVELAYYQGLSQSEIAERTGHPLGTIKGRARTALKQLAEHLSRELAKEVA